MSDLRTKIIRLSHQNPELRKHLLPLVKVALTVGGKKLLEKVRAERKVQPIDNAPFQLSKHPIFKSQLRAYLQYLYSNDDFFTDYSNGINDWKLQPSSIFVDYFIDGRGLVMQINDPNNKMKAKNAHSKTYYIKNSTSVMYVAPSLKRTLYGFRQEDSTWYPVEKTVSAVYLYTHGPFYGERHYEGSNSIKKFGELTSKGAQVWLTKGKVTAFILQPNLNEYEVTSLVNVGKSKTIQELFLGANANQVQRMSYEELKAKIEPRLRRVRWWSEVMPKGWSEYGGVTIKHVTEMDWEYDQNHMSRRQFDNQFYGRMEKVHAALRSEFSEFEVKMQSEYEDGKRIDFEIVER